MFGLENPIHLMIVLVVVLMVFGAKRLPEMGRSLGDGMRGFKDAISGESPPVQAMTANDAAPATVIAAPATVITAPAIVLEPTESAVDVPHAAVYQG